GVFQARDAARDIEVDLGLRDVARQIRHKNLFAGKREHHLLFNGPRLDPDAVRLRLELEPRHGKRLKERPQDPRRTDGPQNTGILPAELLRIPFAGTAEDRQTPVDNAAYAHRAALRPGEVAVVR